MHKKINKNETQKVKQNRKKTNRCRAIVDGSDVGQGPHERLTKAQWTQHPI